MNQPTRDRGDYIDDDSSVGHAFSSCDTIMKANFGKLCVLDDDTLSFKLKTPWSDGTTDLVLSPLELIEKLAALVRPARLNLVRYHGLLAPNAANRDRGYWFCETSTTARIRALSWSLR